MKNYINQTIVFTFLLIVMLVGLSLVPDGFRVGDFSLRKMDIFSDIRQPQAMQSDTAYLGPSIDSTYYTDIDSVQVPSIDSIKPDSIGPFPPKDSVFFGKIIEDYTFDQTGLSRFFAAVDSIKRGRSVRIAWYGDSYVEGDILIGDLRDTLQSVWGGQGVGFVPITSEVAQFKRTLRHQFNSNLWNTYSIIKKTAYRPLLGLNGYAYKPAPGASVQYEGANYFRNTRSWTRVKLFYSAGALNSFIWQLDDKADRADQLKPRGGKIGVWKWDGNYPGTSRFGLRFPQTDSLIVYGATLESGPGIYIDNFSVRGNSGGPLKLLHPDVVKQFDAIQQYDLVVLQVGLNAVTNGYENIRWYEAELERTFNHLRACFPGKPILIISVGDRGGKIDGELATMRGVPAIVSMQRRLARRHGFLFYDLYHGIGGPGSMIRLAQHRPRLANADYTHLTHEGGRVVGLMFANIFLEEQAQWQRKKQIQ